MDNIPGDVYENLIEAFRRNLPTCHRYWAVRRRGLGVDELSMSAPSIPLVKQAIRAISRSLVRDLAMRALDLDGPAEVRELLSTA